jgi:hypothetical protein
VSTAGGIESPEDLRGRRIGVPHYPMTAAVWIRGLLQDEHGLAQGDVSYVVGGLDSPTPMDLPPPPAGLPVRIERAPQGDTLSAMLARGDIAGLYTAKIPQAYDGGKRVRRLFVDYRATERDYLRRTGIFPMMHALVLRQDVYRGHPWAARSLFDAFVESKSRAQAALYDTDALRVMLPWLTEEIEAMRAVLGEDWWPYGLKENRQAIETFLRYHHQQGLSARRLSPEELFAPETLDT